MSGLKPSTPRVHHRQGAPAAWFLMDHPRHTNAGDTGDVADLMGRVPAGTRQGGATWTAGPRGSCLALDGTGYVQVADTPAVQLTGDWTLSLWSYAASGSGTLMAASKQNDYHDAAGWTTYHQNVIGGIWDFIFASGVAIFRTFVVPAPDQWNHYALTGTLSGSILLITKYYNGSWLDAASFGATPSVNAHVLYLGNRDFATQGFVTGRMDDVRFYSRALSAAEIAREYADPYWRLRPPSRAGRLAATFGPRFHPWWLTQSPVLGSGVY
jgi:hypothetical protein